MLLRESSRELGQTVNIEAVVNRGMELTDLGDLPGPGAEGGDRCGEDPYGFPAGTELLRFASAANRAVNPIDPDSTATTANTADTDGRDHQTALTTARAALVAAVGTEGMMEAAATVAIFNGLVRVADGTGIQLDGAMAAASGVLRHGLGLNTMSGAANTPGATANAEPQQAASTVEGLFAD